MKVLKFGGTSVGDAKSLKHVVDIVKNSGEQQVVVVSALGGVTNILVEMAEIASARKNNYKEHLKTLEVCHLNPIQHFVPVTQQSVIISFLKSQLNQLEEILESLFTINELTPKSLAKVSSYGEVLSSTIIFHILKNQGCNVELKDARELLFTHTKNDREVVNHQLSSEKTCAFLAESKAAIALLPGFIAQDEE